MDFKTRYPDFASVEQQILDAKAERSVAIAQGLIHVWEAAERGLARLGKALGAALAAERDKRAIEADTFVKRWVPRP